MHKGLAPIIAIAIVAAFLIGIGAIVGYFKLKSKPTAKTQQAPSNPSPISAKNPQLFSTPDETTNWKTYADVSNKFSFKYPNNWILDTTGVSPFGEDTIYPPFLYENQRDNIRFAMSSEDGTLKQFVEANKESIDRGAIIKTNESVARTKAIRFSYTGPIGEESVTIERSGKLIHLVYHAVDRNISITPGDRELFDQILSTFKFLN